MPIDQLKTNQVIRLFSYISTLILREMEKFEGQNIGDFMEDFSDDACKVYLQI